MMASWWVPSYEDKIKSFPERRVVFGGTYRALEMVDGSRSRTWILEEEVVVNGGGVSLPPVGPGVVLGEDILDRSTCGKHG